MADIARLEALEKILLNYREMFGREYTFDLSNWAAPTSVYVPEENIHVCGTAACALGLACHYPPFIAAGLTICDQKHRRRYPFFEGYENFEAGARFFGISDTESWGLFSRESYVECDSDDRDVPADEVAAKVRTLIDKYKDAENATR